MCCILYIPANVPTPSKSLLQSVYLSNRDGCGYADSDGHYFRTLSFNEFYKHLKAERKQSAGLIIHFRWATHGSVKVQNCHPFVDNETGIVFAHNGVLPIQSKNDMTDSEIFFRETFIPTYKEYGASNTTHLITESVRGSSRFIFMKDGIVTRMGNWYEHHGIFFSNLFWRYRIR